MGLEDYTDTLCQEMSAGQLRRVALARLFISQRPLWVLDDEPFTAIDVLGVSQLEQRLQNHVQQGGTVLLTTHQPLAIAQVKNLTLHPAATRRPMSLETYSLGHALAASLKRELLLAVRQKSELFNPLLFFLVVVVFVPLGITPDKHFLAKLAPGMIWVFALLATLLSLESLFKSRF